MNDFHPEALIKAHFDRILPSWNTYGDTSAKWAQKLVNRVISEGMTSISLLATAKMNESLADGDRHSSTIWKDDFCINISTFACTIEKAKEVYYKQGYLVYLDRILHIVRNENPDCHFIHFQFFWDGQKYYIQFTLYPNRRALPFDPIYHLPIDCLTKEELKSLSLKGVTFSKEN